MATTVQNFGVSTERLQFTGSSVEDMGYAKTFWQSVQLLPPMESRLVSNDIGQRLKAAPVAQQASNKMPAGRGEDPAVLVKFLEKAKLEQRMEQRKRLEHVSHLREQDRAMLHKHRAERVERERISNHAGLQEPPPPAEPALDDPFLFREFDHDVRETALREIDQFEQSKGLAQTHHDDSD